MLTKNDALADFQVSTAYNSNILTVMCSTVRQNKLYIFKDLI